MDSPEAAKTTTTTNNAATKTSSDSPPVQESPFSNYLSNLSPIKPVKAAHVPQGLLGLNSPPLVFTSPRILSERETSFLQRSQCLQIPREEISKNNDGSKKFVDGSDGLGTSVTFLSSRSVTDTEKDNDVEKSMQDQPGSSSGCVDEYLSYPMEMDSVNSVNLVHPNVKQSNDVLQVSDSGLTNPNEVALKFDKENDMRLKVDEPQTLSEQAEEDPQDQPTFETKSVKVVVVEKQSGGEQPSSECPKFESDLSVDHASKKQQCDTLGAQIVQADEDYGDDVEAVLHGPVPEASQLQRGMSRRCLQFEEAQWKTTANSTHSPNPTDNVTGSRSAASAAESDILDTSQVDVTVSSSKKQMMATTLPPHNIGKSPFPVSKPSGIGLHLNSVVNTLPVGQISTASIESTPIMSCHLVENKNICSKLSNLVEKVSITAEDNVLETTNASLATSYTTSETFHTMESLDMLQPLKHQVTPCNKRKFNSEHADNFEEFNQLSLKKKRKKSSSIDGDGCKRCNCKKSKCLKLYCDCFAAGIYCAESCACQGCFNKPEYEDTVLETRQQIESRNPLAFAPKIVQHVTEFPAINVEDGNQFTPSSARHKRGCNCKKSMCLKKYCECYQANVGCSNGCRCEGCKNIYGKKEEYGITKEIVGNRASDERLESTDDNKLEMVATNKDFLPSELYDLHHLTPLTPSFEYSGDAPKSQLISRRYVQSPDSDFSMLPPRHSNSNDMLPERSKEMLDTGSCGREMDYIAEMMDQFSPRCNAIADISDLTPLPNPSSMTMASSSSSKTRAPTHVSRLQLCPGSGRLSSGSSLRWRSSPNTPMTQLGDTKNQAHDSDSGLYNILEDDTPEILKEVSTPIASVKVTSPNKKRVSPPHNHIHELRSSSSGGLKSGRKFILKAVPSFPPLTPCIDSKDKDNTNQK